MRSNIFKIILLLCLPYILFAKVVLTAPDTFFNGDQVVFKITASGENIKFPTITTIDGVAVQNAGTSNSTTIINGNRSQIIAKTYAFIGTKDITIPPFKIQINGKTEQTKSKTIKMKTIKKTISSNYSLDIDVDKKDVYVGEDLLFTLKFKYKKDAQIVDLNFYKPTFENFWKKELQSQTKQIVEGDFIVQELKYLLFPQKAGKLNITALRIDAIVMENSRQNYGFFGSQSTKTIPIYSNKIELNVKPLPDNTKLIGDFKITSSIDKNNLNSGDAVSYKLTITGRGNVDDIDEIKLNIPNTTIYDNPAKKEFNLKDGQYGGIYSKTYSIVSQNSFEIPPITLNYFDKNSNSVKTIKTKSYKIKVNDTIKKEVKLEVQKPKETQTIATKKEIITKVVKTSDNQKIIFFVLGLIVGILLVLLYLILKNKTTKRDETSLEKNIKKSKSSQELLKILVVYINIDKKLDKIIYNLGENSDSLDIKKVKKDILNILKDRRLEVSF